MATLLGSKPVGSIVTLKVDGAAQNFIVVHQGRPSTLYDASCDGTWLLMEDCYEKSRKWHTTTSGSYAGSAIHSYLNGDFLKKFDTDIQNAIKQVKIPYNLGNASKTVNSGANGLSCKIFLLSGYELGWTTTDNQCFPEDGAKLSYFLSGAGTDANSKRIAKVSGSAMSWWTRSPYTGYVGDAWSVGSSGDYSRFNYLSAFGTRPVLILPSNLSASDDGSVSTNTAPSMPASINVPSSIMGGSTITVSWAASTDAESNLAGYEVQKSVDGGSQWTQIYRSQSTTTSAQDSVTFGTNTVMYRVKAFDSEGLESGWCTSASVKVVNNVAPGAPPSITVPNDVKGGATLIVSWAKATDSDGNLSGYELERQVNGQGWEQVYSGDKLTFTDSITKGWNTVAYRVRAYDSLNAAGAYTTSATRTVNNNTAPVITCDSSGSDLGEKDNGFIVSYSVDDEDGDTVTVTESIDGTQKRKYTPTLKGSNSFTVTGETFMKLLNGKRTLTISAADGKATTNYTLTFTKKVTSASITLDEPMSADDEITLCAISVIGSIPADAGYRVEVTNNANDDEPVWQDVTASVKAGANIPFENKTAEKGWAFNFRVKVERGPSGVGGYITSVQGGFQ